MNNLHPGFFFGDRAGEREMKLYIVASYERKAQIEEYAQFISEHIPRIKVVSTWHNTPWQAEGTLTQAELASLADQALFEIFLAEAILIFSEPPASPFKRGGRHVELGYALRAMKTIYLIGPRENIFYNLPEVIHFPSWSIFCSYCIKDSCLEV